MQHESPGLAITGMTALICRTREASSKTAATVEYVTSFSDLFATSSWPREAHIHRSKEGDGFGGAASHRKLAAAAES
jgi:hypothetical protein